MCAKDYDAALGCSINYNSLPAAAQILALHENDL